MVILIGGIIECPPHFSDKVAQQFGSDGKPYGDTYYKGTWGVQSENIDYPSSGSLAFCENSTIQPHTSKCNDRKTNCIGGTFPEKDNKNVQFLPRANSIAGVTTGYRIVSENSNPYYYYRPNINGTVYCEDNAGNYFPLTDLDENGEPLGEEFLPNYPGGSSTTTTQKECEKKCTDDDCYMYVFDSNEGGYVSNPYTNSCSILTTFREDSKEKDPDYTLYNHNLLNNLR